MSSDKARTWHVARLPQNRIVTGLFTDREAAAAEAERLTEEKAFDYQVKRAGRLDPDDPA